MRLFLGIYPDKETLDYCRDIYREFDKEKRNLKQVPLDQVHLTMRFVGGKVSDNSKNMIIEQLRSMQGSFPKPEIKIKRLRFGFPRQHDPRVLFADVYANDDLLELQDQINRVIRKNKLRDTIRWKSHKDRHFHITIARLKPAATRSTGRNIKDILYNIDMPKPEGYVAQEMYAIQSILDSKGKPNYRTLEKIIL